MLNFLPSSNIKHLEILEYVFNLARKDAIDIIVKSNKDFVENIFCCESSLTEFSKKFYVSKNENFSLYRSFILALENYRHVDFMIAVDNIHYIISFFRYIDDARFDDVFNNLLKSYYLKKFNTFKAVDPQISSSSFNHIYSIGDVFVFDKNAYFLSKDGSVYSLDTSSPFVGFDYDYSECYFIGTINL